MTDKLAAAIFADKDSPSPIDQGLYDSYTKLFNEGLNKVFAGFKDYILRDDAMIASLRTNLFAFSGAKTIQVYLQMRGMLLDAEGNIRSFTDFKNDVLANIDETYNKAWLKAEYDTAIGSAQMASKWKEFQDNPAANFLTWLTTGGENVCEICGPLNGLTLPKDDPFWETYWPLLHFLCHCNITASAHEQEDKVSSTDEAHRRMKGVKIAPYFKQNSGMSGVVFDENTPYLQGKEPNSWDAEKMYGLPRADKLIDAAKTDMATGEESAWRHNYQTMMAPYQIEETADYAVKTATGDVLTFNDDFISHMHENKQQSEGRHVLLGNVIDVMQKPSEVWATVTDKKVNMLYIKYYKGGALVVAANAVGKRIIAKTFYKDNGNIKAARKGVLLYRK